MLDDAEFLLAQESTREHKELLSIIDSQESSVAYKLEVMHTKYMELFGYLKRLEKDHEKLKQTVNVMQKEKDTLASDLARSTQQKKKLEDLARELSRESKRSTEEHRCFTDSEQQKRNTLSARFEATISEIKSKMQDDQSDKQSRAEDAIELKSKFKSFLEQYDLREKHYCSVIKSKNIETQLADARYHQQKQLTEQECLNASTLNKQIKDSIKSEAELRTQLESYIDKFKQVESTLNKSNDLFVSFRKEMDDKQKIIRKLERESSVNVVKLDQLNGNILQMAEESQKQLGQEQKTRAKLEQLCRALQAERKRLDAQILRYEVEEEASDDECCEHCAELNKIVQ